MVIDGARRVRVNQSYVDAVAGAGLMPLVIPPMRDVTAVGQILDVVEGLVLTGGEDVDPRYFGEAPHPATGAPHAERDSTELALAREALRRQLPTLAICRGVQLINIALGGTLIQDVPTQVAGAGEHYPKSERNARVHRVTVQAGSELSAAIGATEIDTNSFHHQSLARVPNSLRVTACTADGVVEGVESADPAWWMLGVQWHPEDLVNTPEDWDRRLFGAFARAVRSARSVPA